MGRHSAASDPRVLDSRSVLSTTEVTKIALVGSFPLPLDKCLFRRGQEACSLDAKDISVRSVWIFSPQRMNWPLVYD